MNYSKFDELVQQVQTLQSVIGANKAIPRPTTDASAVSIAPIQQGGYVPVVTNLDRISFSNDRHHPQEVVQGLRNVSDEVCGFTPEDTGSFLIDQPSCRSNPSPSDGSADRFAANNPEKEIRTPVSQLRLESMPPATTVSYNDFSQGFETAQPREIGSISLPSNQICHLFQM